MQRKVLGGSVQPKEGKLKEQAKDDKGKEIKPSPTDVDSIEFKVPEGAPDVTIGSEGVMLLSNAPNTGHFTKDDVLLYVIPKFKTKMTLKVLSDVGPTKYKVKRIA
ncbi:MAG: hypothetical protein EOP39_18020 [Rubrivivax sp.]|nr:MAG: hypothetical protein EOP39_18020 [Rubrivivax sp.]